MFGEAPPFFGFHFTISFILQYLFLSFSSHYFDSFVHCLCDPRVVLQFVFCITKLQICLFKASNVFILCLLPGCQFHQTSFFSWRIFLSRPPLVQQIQFFIATKGNEYVTFFLFQKKLFALKYLVIKKGFSWCCRISSQISYWFCAIIHPRKRRILCGADIKEYLRLFQSEPLHLPFQGLPAVSA